MRDLSPPRTVAKIVKPHKDANETIHIIACDASGVCRYEGTRGIDWEISGLVQFLHERWPQTRNKCRVKMALICHNPHKILGEVENAFGEDPNWNVRISVSEGESDADDGCTFYRKERKRVTYFGFRDKQRHTHYFYPIAASEFLDSLDDYGDEHETEMEKLLALGNGLRNFCNANRIRISSSRGGISAQLLRDQRFYPRIRRKVPLATNEAARVALPGNCYQMQEHKIDRYYKGVYVIDQQNAHHHAAESVVVPNANSLFAYGWYWNQSDDEWLNYRDPIFKDALNEHGLFRVRASAPRKHSGYLPPWARPHGRSNGGSVLSDIWLFSNEIALAESLGVQIRHISRWYAAPDGDDGLRTYAQWCQDQITEYPDERSWLKSTLLSAYGILGARPRYLESGYKRTDKGTPHTYHIGARAYKYNQVKTTRKIQSPVANVIQRGMIEAETRKLSIELARKMDKEGHNVIAIHADAILVEDEGQQLPLLSPPWRVKDRLSHFKALDAVSFISDELEILPGRPRSSREKEQWRRSKKYGHVRQRQSVRT